MKDFIYFMVVVLIASGIGFWIGWVERGNRDRERKRRR